MSHFPLMSLRGWWPWAAAVLSGVLTGFSFPPFSQEWLIWVALMPLIGAVWFRPRAKGFSWRQGVVDFSLGWVAGSSGFFIHLFWITEVTGAGWFLLSVYCGLYPALFALFIGSVGYPRTAPGSQREVWLSSRANLWYAVLGAMAWTGTEWLRGTLLSGFGWNGLGVALWENVAMIQITDITGVGGLSFLIALTNLVLVQTLRRLQGEIRVGKLRAHYDFAFTLAASALVFSYGIRQLLAPPPPSHPLKVAAVQPNVAQEQKWDPAFEQQILDRYRKQSEFAIALDPDLLVWPEASTPRPVLLDRTNGELVATLVASWPGDLLLGTVHFDALGDFNSALFLPGKGEKYALYHKIHLVPFGEFVPFRESFPLFAWIVGDLVSSDFDAGTVPVVFELQRVPLRAGPLICFEDTLGRLARHFVQAGAQFFVVLTNDGWFRESAGSRQHLAQSVFRSAENKVPMLRAANTGVTGWIDRHGRVVEILATPDGNTFLEGVFFGEFPVPLTSDASDTSGESAHTFYTRHGEVFSVACLILAFFWGIFSLLRNSSHQLLACRKGTPKA